MLTSKKTSSSRLTQPLIKILSGESLSSPPVWLMRQAGRYLPEYREVRKKEKTFLGLCYNSDLATQVTLQPLERFALDAAIIFSDILVIPDALGQNVSFQEKKGPVLEPLELGNLSKLAFNKETLEPVYQALSNVRRSLPDDKTLLGFAGAPWTLATYMIEGGSSKDFQKTKQWAYSDPKSFLLLMNILVDAVSDHLINQVKAGADALQLFDSWAGVLPEEEFYKWVINPTYEIVKKVKSKCPDVPVIGFPRGAGLYYKDYAENSGVDAISFDQYMPLGWVRNNIHIPVQGNLDPVLLLADKERMLAKVHEIMSMFKDRPFIFNLGHGVLPGTPVENVQALIQEVKKAR